MFVLSFNIYAGFDFSLFEEKNLHSTTLIHRI